MVSPEIEGQRDAYVQLMRAHGAMTRDDIGASVRETQGRLLAILNAVPEAQALRAPAREEWSLRELTVHAAFTERLVARLVHDMARGAVPPAEAFEGAGIGMMPKDAARPWREAVSELERRNADLLAAVRDLPAEPDRELRLPHPFFGPLNCLEWAGFQRVHDLDHIQHAERIIAATRA